MGTEETRKGGNAWEALGLLFGWHGERGRWRVGCVRWLVQGVGGEARIDRRGEKKVSLDESDSARCDQGEEEGTDAV